MENDAFSLVDILTPTPQKKAGEFVADKTIVEPSKNVIAAASVPPALAKDGILPVIDGASISPHVRRLLTILNWAPSDRAPGLHCSELYGFCPRRQILSLLHPISGMKDVDALTMARFNYGTALHSLYQNSYLGPVGLLFGKWRCRRCGKRSAVEDWSLMPPTHCDCHNCDVCQWPIELMSNKHCQLCDYGNDWVYEETEVRDSGYVGRVDGLLLQGDGKEYVLLELKTAGPKSYKSLSAPYPSHILQASLYMRALKVKKAVIVYIDKANEDTNLVKEFWIDYDELVVKETLDLIARYEAALRDKIIPLGIRCDASKCAWSQICLNAALVTDLEKRWKDVA